MDMAPEKPPFAELTVGRATLALIIGGVMGASTTALGIVVTGAFSGQETEPQSLQETIGERLTMIPVASLIFLPALVLWLAGLFAIGAPGWFLLHRARLRSFPVALIYGFTLVLATAWLPGPGPKLLARGDDWQPTLLWPALLGLAGAVVGAVVWRFAYRGRPAR